MIKSFLHHCSCCLSRPGRSAGLSCGAGAWAETRMFWSTTRVTMPKSPFASSTCTAASRWTRDSPSNAKSSRTALCSTSRRPREPSTWWQKRRRRWPAGFARSANCADSTSQRTIITVGESFWITLGLTLINTAHVSMFTYRQCYRSIFMPLSMWFYSNSALIWSNVLFFFPLWADDTTDRIRSQVTWCHFLLLSFSHPPPPLFSVIWESRDGPALPNGCSVWKVYWFFFSPFVLLKKREWTLPINAGTALVFILETVVFDIKRTLCLWSGCLWITVSGLHL